jgi:hypothetical protein
MSPTLIHVVMGTPRGPSAIVHPTQMSFLYSDFEVGPLKFIFDFFPVEF